MEDWNRKWNSLPQAFLQQVKMVYISIGCIPFFWDFFEPYLAMIRIILDSAGEPWWGARDPSWAAGPSWGSILPAVLSLQFPIDLILAWCFIGSSKTVLSLAFSSVICDSHYCWKKNMQSWLRKPLGFEQSQFKHLCSSLAFHSIVKIISTSQCQCQTKKCVILPHLNTLSHGGDGRYYH